MTQATDHLVNEWADMATNGIQWLRNIRGGISTPVDALAEMEANLKRIQELRAKTMTQATDDGMTETMTPYGELSKKAIGLAEYFLDTTGDFPPGASRKVAVWVLADKLQSAFDQERAEATTQLTAKVRELLPAMQSFEMRPVGGGSLVQTEGSTRFVHERDVKAFKDAALAQIATLTSENKSLREAVLSFPDAPNPYTYRMTLERAKQALTPKEPAT